MILAIVGIVGLLTGIYFGWVGYLYWRSGVEYKKAVIALNKHEHHYWVGYHMRLGWRYQQRAKHWDIIARMR